MAQGRPMGLLVALLQFPCTGHVAAHRDAMASFDHDVRLTARHTLGRVKTSSVVNGHLTAATPMGNLGSHRDESHTSAVDVQFFVWWGHANVNIADRSIAAIAQMRARLLEPKSPHTVLS